GGGGGQALRSSLGPLRGDAVRLAGLGGAPMLQRGRVGHHALLYACVHLTLSPPLTPMVVHGADPDRLMMGGWEPGARVAKAQILRRSIQLSFGPEGGPSGSRTHDLRV